MFGLSKREKLAKKFRTEAQYTMGEVTYFGTNPVNMLFKGATGIDPKDTRPSVMIRFTTPEGEQGETSCTVSGHTFTVGERVRVKYVRYENRLIGIVDPDRYWEDK